MLTRLLLIFLLVLFVGRAVWRLLTGVVEGATGTGRAALHGRPSAARAWCATRSAARSWYSRAR